MKKIFIISLLLLICIVLVGCGSKNKVLTCSRTDEDEVSKETEVITTTCEEDKIISSKAVNTEVHKTKESAAEAYEMWQDYSFIDKIDYDNKYTVKLYFDNDDYSETDTCDDVKKELEANSYKCTLK